MNKYLIEYCTNYGTQVIIVNAKDEKEAKCIADIHGAWDTNTIIDITDMDWGFQYISETHGGWILQREIGKYNKIVGS